MRTSAWALAAVLLSATDASAFECGLGSDGQSLFWPVREVRWVVEQEVLDAIGSQALSETQRSFDAWSQVTCSDFTLTFDGIVPSATAELDGLNAVAYVPRGAQWPYAEEAIAATLLNYNTRTSELVDVDIELNGVSFNIQRVEPLTCDVRGPNMDYANTLTHEVGHLVGLNHPPDEPAFAETTMYARAPRCEIKKRSLEQDDIDGICFVYPAGGPTRRCTPVPEESGCRHTSPPGDSAPAWFLLGLAFVLARMRR